MRPRMDARGGAYQRPADTLPYQKEVTSLRSKASPRRTRTPLRHTSPSASRASETGPSPRKGGWRQDFTNRTLRVRLNGDDDTKGQETSYCRARTAVSECAGAQIRESGRLPSFAPRRRCACHHRVRPRIRRPASGHRNRVSSTAGLSRFAVLFFLLAFYARKCLNRGLFSSRLFLHDTKKRGDGALSPEKNASLEARLDWNTGPFRRLASEERSPPVSSAEKEKSSGEEALCSAIEASARASRAAAAKAPAGESAGETPPGSPTERASIGIESGCRGRSDRPDSDSSICQQGSFSCLYRSCCYPGSLEFHAICSRRSDRDMACARVLIAARAHMV